MAHASAYRSFRIVRRLLALVTALAPAVAYGQGADVQTFQELRIERDAAPGTYLTFSPPTTAITPHTLLWPYDPPIANARLVAFGTGPYQLKWSVSTNYLIELQSSGQLNLRRSAGGVEGGIVGVPGYISNDFQGSRSNANQSADGDRSVIMGGRNNDANGSNSAIGGGFQNQTNQTQATVLGGQNNNGNGYRAAMLGGSGNTVSANTAVVVGGESNANSSNLGFIGGGSSNSSSGNTATIGGGVQNSNSSNLGTILGGYQNTMSGNNPVIFGGYQNSSSGERGAIGGGRMNSNPGGHGFIGGGESNSTNGTAPAVFGGFGNASNGSQSVSFGGYDNDITPNQGVITGGQLNRINGGERVVIGGGYSNTVSTNQATILGGSSSSVTSEYATTIGGQSMTNGGQNSLMLNGGTNAVSSSTSNIVFMNNMSVWISDNDASLNTLRFYEAYGTSGAYPGANTNYVGFNAPTATNGDVDNSYTLPDRIVTTFPRYLTIGSTPTPSATAATLTWDAPTTPHQYSVSAVTVNGTLVAPTNAAAANVNDDLLLRATSNQLPLNRRMTMANGATDGFVITVRVVSNSVLGTNGFQMYDADANLELAGDALLNENDTLTLVWDATSGVWIEVDRSAN